MKMLVFAGAGTSVELGVPSMWGLAGEFLAHTEQWKIEPEFVREVMESELDVEHLIEEVDRICEGGASLEKIGRNLDDLAKAEKVRAEVEWFVQHAAERVTPRNAQLMWGSVLRASEMYDITFVTTNYDRAIELAANGEGVLLEDGFASLDNDEMVSWSGFMRERVSPKLIKLHGSTDWFSERHSGDPVKIRHPMALFGRATLLFGGTELGSALVLPSREKLLTRAPYPRLTQAFLNAADECEVAFFVGSSLRDEHIRNAARAISSRAPVFVVNTSGDSRGVDGALTMAEHASTFLISTLPNALCASNPLELLEKHSKRSVKGQKAILSIVKELLNEDSERKVRCNAAELLHERRVTLAPTLVEKVLNQGDAIFGRYALGLIPYSAAYRELMEVARNSVHSGDEAYRDEVAILQRVVSKMEGNRELSVECSDSLGGGQESAGEIGGSAAA